MIINSKKLGTFMVALTTVSVSVLGSSFLTLMIFGKLATEPSSENQPENVPPIHVPGYPSNSLQSPNQLANPQYSVDNKPKSFIIDAPIIQQKPELPSGCELTSLTMLLQFYGVKKTKMELLPEMLVDPTPIQWDDKGNIVYWGNPNLGFVGDITAKSQGFSIYHTALFQLMATYIPTSVDLTRSSFDLLERQVAAGIPVVVWTTIGFKETPRWYVWDSPLGPIKGTFSVHAVLLVGYDESYVYVNDPLTGVKQEKVLKEQFIKTWDLQGRQALSYIK
ncbi:C39 family peptidase [Paenibacillus agricola]|uniref:Peptidase C39-like domain-containing protein n=1 Tax=Paenibacillus agricola TaxID=2716264 RepID=A0ABX0JCT2_9BACL|nr:C39 family peptidase [Paenibacillus agricola]NHN33190.1 hypothetical protein [Paenibacillus agricola]